MDYFDKSILKKKKKNNYTSISNGFLQDNSLSFEARGLGASLLSRPDDWEINVSALMIEGNIGRDKVRKIINELIQAGYMYKSQGRTSGKFAKNILFISDEKDYLFEEVIEKDMTSLSLEKCEVLPQTENPSTVKPLTENPQQQIQLYNKKKNITKTTTAIQDTVNKIEPVSSEQKKVSSSSSYEFLNNFEIDLGTKENIKKYIHGLTEERFSLVYSEISKRFQEGKIKNFSAGLFTALKDNWIFETDTQTSVDSEKEEKQVKGTCGYYIDFYKCCGGSVMSLIQKFENDLQHIKNKDLVTKYKNKLLQAVRKEE